MIKLKNYIYLVIILAVTLVSCAEDCQFTGIATDELTEAKLNQEYYYKIELETTCSVVFRSVEIIDGTLPDGMSMDGSGAITGTPSETGTFEFEITARTCFGSNGFEYTGCSDKTKTLTLVVSE